MKHPLYPIVLLLILAGVSPAALPEGSAPPALTFAHFPDGLHAVVWRNWNVVPTARIARVVGASEQEIRDLAGSMGLPAERPISADREARQYLSVIRRNWHLLDYDQLLQLLNWPEDRLENTLREDDFLWVKLGSLKPKCGRVTYARPTPEARRREEQIKRTIESEFGDALAQGGEEPFAFVERFRAGSNASPNAGLHFSAGPPHRGAGLRMVYSYFAVYGDPLLDPALDPYPDELLRELSESGVNAVWLHVVLRDLAPSRQFPEFGKGHEQRLDNLRKLVDRARRFGVGVYLYINEPRAMPAAFFATRPELAGVREGNYVAMCTSQRPVRQWISDSLEYIFKTVPNLAGVFTITASENLTNCASHGQFQSCPHCKGRSGAEILAEVNATIEQGVHRGNPKARVIVWDWGWPDAWATDVIRRLPKSTSLMSVSEWGLPIERGGVHTTVGEYSMSAVGPGALAKDHWRLATESQLATVAKVQVSNTWELSAVPWITVPDLVARHCQGLRSAGVGDLMLSWTLGGYPSPNLQVADRMLAPFDKLRAGQTPAPTAEQVLDDLARQRYGPRGAALARRGWTEFSTAFEQYPFDAGVIYTCPVQVGPANLLYARATGYRATMVGFPYDDLRTWRGPYSAEVFAAQFGKLADGWTRGLAALEQATRLAPEDLRPSAESELRIARAAQLHFQSVADQSRFVMVRDALSAPGLTPERRLQLQAEIRAILTREIATAKALFVLARRDSRIGFEASNQYYYFPQDLEEKALNCRDLLERFHD